MRRLLNSAFLYMCSALVFVFHNSKKENCFRKTKPPHASPQAKFCCANRRREREVYFVGVIIAPFDSKIKISAYIISYIDGPVVLHGH